MSTARQTEIERLFRSHGRGIGSFVLARVGNPELAEEITARVFLQVVRHYEQLRGSPLPWLWSIVRNELGKHFRSSAKFQPVVDTLEDGRLLPDAEIERRENSEKLQAALAVLPEEHQQIVCMKFFLKMKNHEIADAVGMTSSNVGVRLFRALRQLRALMSGPSEPIRHTGEAKP